MSAEAAHSLSQEHHQDQERKAHEVESKDNHVNQRI